MILKKLTLTGFKSFCDQTEFEFGDGITCVVGPNGCGKSNIVDAVKWVLGEQSAKSLRGHSMLDMIFNGSSTRRSSGMAQVDLLFDNSDKSLNLEQTEVTVSRRLYRSGESGYLLNQNPCRLKDIRELFLDTGVGVDAYSVIEQGRVDILLQSNPSERRAIFEEAAGISKYKARRKEAERKLARTEQNLLRARDIMEELEKRLRSVKLQAGKAKRFKEYDQRLRELRSHHALAEYHRLTKEHARVSAELATCTDRVIETKAALSRCEAKDSDLANSALEFDRMIDECNQQITSLKSEITTFEERSRLAKLHQAEQEELLDGFRAQIEQNRPRIHKLEQDIQREQAQLPDLITAYQTHSDQVAVLTDRDHVLAREITESQATLEDEKSGLIDLLYQSSRIHNQISELDVHREALSDQKSRLQARHGQVGQRLEEALGRKALALRRTEEIEHLTSEQQRRLDAKAAAMAEAKHTREQISEELALLLAKRSGLSSQQELLEDLERQMDGVDQPVRELLRRKAAAPDNPRLAAIHGLVADIVTTDSEHAPVIEAALERWAQHLVVDDSEAFLSLNGELKDLKGRLHVLSADRLSPVMDTRDFAGQDGVVCRALELVKFPDRLEYLTRSILGKTIVVESFDHALALAKEDPHGHEFVTLKGEVVDSNGRMVLGEKSEQTGLISRKSRLREVHEQITQVDNDISGLNDRLLREEADSTHFETVVQNLRESIHQNNASRAAVQSDLQHALEEIDRLMKEQPLIAGEVEMIEQGIATAIEESSKSRESLDQVQEQNRGKEAEREAYEKRMKQLTAEQNNLRKSLTESRVAAGQLGEKKTAVEDLIDSLKSSFESAHSSLQDHIAHCEQCESRINDSLAAIEQADQQAEGLTEQLSHHESETLKVRHQRESLRKATEELAAQAKLTRAQLSELEEQRHAKQMNLQESELRRDELRTRIKEELQIDLASVYASYAPEDQDAIALDEEITTLREKISRLGNINLDAITEQQELEGRLAFLTTQHEDLDHSREQLEELIKRLNIESRDRFLNTFNEIRTQFQELFRKLFGGGKADLVLDPTCDDILEAGIEIFVRPPGKELQRITLLSGGEKALTAIALLLSIFKTKPSPFVLLDEVDAALDEANNDRFNRIVREFLDQTQFIIITHSKRTMHIADTLYGVTMQEPGVSRRVSVRFEDHAGETAVA